MKFFYYENTLYGYIDQNDKKTDKHGDSLVKKDDKFSGVHFTICMFYMHYPSVELTYADYIVHE
jgi:hypothetical protein